MKKITAAQTGVVRILYPVNNPPTHKGRYLYHAFHTNYPCYISSDCELKRDQEIPFSQLQQQFKSAAIGGVATYHYAGAPQKHNRRSQRKAGNVDFEGGKDILIPT